MRRDPIHTSQSFHKVLVWLGLLGAVIPSAIIHLASVVFAVFAIRMPQYLLAYAIGWWAIFSLIRVFLNFLKGSPVPGAFTWFGIFAGSTTVLVLAIPAFTGTPACPTCSVPRRPGYSPHFLCILVGIHLAYLYWQGFRLSKSPAEGACPAFLDTRT